MDLDASAQAFLDRLGLPTLPPLRGTEGVEELLNDDVLGAISQNITRDVTTGPTSFELPDAAYNTTLMAARQLPPPHVGSISLLELHDHSIGEFLLTTAAMALPVLAMVELWMRLFAFFLCPVCLCWILRREIAVTKKNARKPTQQHVQQEEEEHDKEASTLVVHLVGLASSSVLSTDSLYIYEYGRCYGAFMLLMSSMLAYHTPKKEGSLPFKCLAALIIVTTISVALGDVLQRDLPNTATPNDPLQCVRHPGIDVPTIEEGSYYSHYNHYISSIMSNWPKASRTYDVRNGATPYLVTGDQRTGIPWFVNSVEEPEYCRVWAKARDGEHIALDIAFPYGRDDVGDIKFVHDLNRPVYMVLHGLNGGSRAEYVKDFVKRRRAEGSTVVVMVARGMMDTETVGWNSFHVARTGDVDVTARSLMKAMTSLADANQVQQRQILVGVGYSVGAIILSNYAARAGEDCSLDAAMAISGGLDIRQQLNFERSKRLWQPMITLGYRKDTVGKYGRHFKDRLAKDQFLRMLRVTSISVS